MKKTLSFILAIMMIISCSSVASAVASASPTFDATTYTQSPYFGTLKSAYEEYSSYAYLAGKFVTLSLEDFVCNYNPNSCGTVNAYLSSAKSSLSSNFSRQAVISQAAEIAAEADNESESIQRDLPENGDNVTRSGSTAWYYHCPELSQPNAYGTYNLLDNTISGGDVVIDQQGFAGLTGHIAIVVGHFYSSVFSSYYVRVVEAVSGGVSYGILCDQRVDERDSYVYRVSTTNATRLNAVSWANSQIGKDFLLVVSDYTKQDVSSSRPNWYCSLLCYAAYKAQGINLATKNGNTVLYPRNLVASPYMTERDIGR